MCACRQLHIIILPPGTNRSRAQQKSVTAKTINIRIFRFAYDTTSNNSRARRCSEVLRGSPRPPFRLNLPSSPPDCIPHLSYRSLHFLNFPRPPLLLLLMPALLIRPRRTSSVSPVNKKEEPPNEKMAERTNAKKQRADVAISFSYYSGRYTYQFLYIPYRIFTSVFSRPTAGGSGEQYAHHILGAWA